MSTVRARLGPLCDQPQKFQLLRAMAGAPLWTIQQLLLRLRSFIATVIAKKHMLCKQEVSVQTP